MEFKDKAVDDEYGDLCEQETQLEDELDTIRQKIANLIANNEAY